MSQQQIFPSYFQAITTRYYGPTNHRGARCKAQCEACTATLPWDHAKGLDDNHIAAAQALIDQMGWDGQYVGGHAKGGMVFVCVAKGDWRATPRA